MFVVLQCVVFFENGLTEQEVCVLDYNPRLVRIGFRLHKFLSKNDGILKKGGFDGI